MNAVFTIAFWNQKFYNENYKFYSIDLMRKVIYVYLIYNSLILLPYAAEIWGPDSMVIPYPVYQYSTSQFVNLLFHPVIAPYFYVFVFLQILFLFMGIFSFFPRVSAVMVFILTTNLSNRMYLMNTAGEQLILIFLFFLMFFAVKKENKTELQMLINNVCSMALFFQMVIVYFFAGIYKLYYPEWLNGSAMFLTLMMDEFSHPIIKNNLTGNNFFLIIGTYISIFYQLCFPIFIWFMGIRKYFLWVGIAFHLSISFFLGIFGFGIIMLIAYIMYMENEKAYNILAGFNKLFRLKNITKQKADDSSSFPSPQI
jgi:hypothetical protein